jgi:hypothetical protein
MGDKKRTDLPHDQVAQDNDGQVVTGLESFENPDPTPGVNEEPLAGTIPTGENNVGIDERREAEGTSLGGIQEERVTEEVGTGFDEERGLGRNNTGTLLGPNDSGYGNQTTAELYDPIVDEEFATETTPGVNEEFGSEINPGVDEEFATEVNPIPPAFGNGEKRRNENNEAMVEETNEAGGTGLGWGALVLSILSLFFLPVLTASIGVVTGFFAYRNGSRTLGMWSIAIGLFSIIFAIFFAPLVR